MEGFIYIYTFCVYVGKNHRGSVTSFNRRICDRMHMSNRRQLYKLGP